MRTLAVLFLLANLGLAGWQYQQHVQASTREALRRQPIPAEVPKLALLRELPALPPAREPAPVADAQVDAEVQENVAGANLCVDVGPYHDTASRNTARDWLREHAAAIYSRNEPVHKNQFFWIYLEPGSAESADAREGELHERGIKDTMIIRRGELKNAISLGFFRSQDSVNRRLAEATEQGYKPIVVPKFDTVDAFWIAARLKDDEAEAPAMPADVLASAKVQTIDCTAMKTGAEGEGDGTGAKPAPLVEGLTN